MIKIDVPKMRMEFKKNDEERDKGLKEPKTVKKVENLSYGNYGQDNLFDIYYPIDTKKVLPTIINIHGGGFFYGDKELYKYYTMFLASKGFTVVNFNYRLAPENKYPAPLEDINELVKWLLKEATCYNIDINNLFLMGDSAGGQLAEQYATLASNKNYQKLFDFKVPKVKFRAISLNCGVYFIGKDAPINKDFPFYFDEKLDEKTNQQFPVEDFITSDFPPCMITTASHDFLKDLAKPFHQILEAKKVSSKYNIYSNFDDTELHHVFHLDLRNSVGIECNRDIINFFQKFIQV
ncbi:alpha/beta hydrolase (plasmid) [Vagococcus lutrae]|uniref:alpha/beta hydrolase n=1 Tax=Vagococcus lutrae TaxID=81947 RepID=UPI00232C568E|nr:alpha/beta hydrolase [Vagococcus lutrae]WCG06119.1 alpha/beta hydrolase [Vagococcus lutrae]